MLKALARSRRLLVVAAMSVALAASAAAPAYGGFDDDGSTNDWQESLFGTWRLVSVDPGNGPVVRCPGRWTNPNGYVIRCGRADKLQINADHTYRDTLPVTPGNRGIWAAWVGIIAFDDHDRQADPRAYRFRLKANQLIIWVDVDPPGPAETPSRRATMTFVRGR